MADTYSSTVLQAAREWQFETMLKKFEERRDFSNVYKPFFDGQRFIEDYAEKMASLNQTQTIMYLTKPSISITSDKTCTPDGDLGASASVNLSWSKKVATVKVRTKQHENNELKMGRALANLLFSAESAMWTESSGMEAAFVSWLDTNRTYVNAISTGTVSENTWSGAPLYTVDVAYADRVNFWNYAVHDMELNNYGGKIWDIANTFAGTDRTFYSNQGDANSTNYEFQFNMPSQLEFVKSNKIQPSGYVKDIHYLIPEGGVAALFYNEQMNREGRVSSDKEWSILESMIHPGIYYDLFTYETCTDTTSHGGDKQDLVINYELTLNYALTKQPLSTANETTIFKYRVRNT